MTRCGPVSLLVLVVSLGACSVLPDLGDGGARDLGGWRRDGGVDASCDGADRLWYPDCDRDGDGHMGSTPLFGCTEPAWPPLCDGEPGVWVTTHGDCDDLQAGVSSFARERCNGLDEDCDGEIDEEPTSSESCADFDATYHTVGSRCVDHACVWAACEDGYGDCSPDSVGCETNVLYSSVSCGACGHPCPLDALRCSDGVCQAGPTDPPGPPVEPAPIAGALDADGSVTCAVTATDVQCWGTGGGVASPSPVPVALGGAAMVGVTSTATCGLTALRDIVCAGTPGPLTDDAMEVTFPAALGMGDVLAVGGGHACVTLTSGAVECWGTGTSGELGDGMLVDHGAPAEVPGVTDAVHVDVGSHATCVALRDGHVDCWGVRALDGTIDATPVRVGGIERATRVAVGDGFVCALREDGTVACWGENDLGQLGDGSTISRSSPLRLVFGLADAVAITAGAHHACAISHTRGALCWGSDASEQLGNGAGAPDRCGATACATTPVSIGDARSAIAVAAGDAHTCAALDLGGVLCWGEGSAGELGDGVSLDSDSPVRVAF